ncbi:MAG: hypothetical protein JSU86_03275 [Phycisphaerales bacterium]|nr:MAG: hypothetical protein JSU86_03275 [Phycisphaerales bacterium]
MHRRRRFIPIPKAREAWICVDHLIFDQVACDAQGSLIFQLPGIIRKPTMVDVITPPAGQASSEE